MCCFWTFHSKSDWSTLLVFSFSDTLYSNEYSIKETSLRFAGFLTLRSICKDTVDMNQNTLGKWKIRVEVLDFNPKFECRRASNRMISSAFNDKFGEW